MIKRCLVTLSCLLISFSLFSFPVFSAGYDPNALCSLDLTYPEGFTGQSVSIYRVAEIDAQGQYKWLSEYAHYPINLTNVDSLSKWSEIAQTLASYVEADVLTADAAGTITNLNTVQFTGLKTGLYLVRGNVSVNEQGIAEVQDFMIALPQVQNNNTIYQAQIHVKSSYHAFYETYQVMKLWDDHNSKNRPDSVSVELYKDGYLHSTVVLNQQNNWSYSWKSDDLDASWSVIEKNVDEHYQVSIVKNETSFIITNTLMDPTDEPENPPLTSDTSSLLMYSILMCISGAGLMFLGLIGLRGKRHA